MFDVDGKEEWRVQKKKREGGEGERSGKVMGESEREEWAGVSWRMLTMIGGLCVEMDELSRAKNCTFLIDMELGGGCSFLLLPT